MKKHRTTLELHTPQRRYLRRLIGRIEDRTGRTLRQVQVIRAALSALELSRLDLSAARSEHELTVLIANAITVDNAE